MLRPLFLLLLLLCTAPTITLAASNPVNPTTIKSEFTPTTLAKRIEQGGVITYLLVFGGMATALCGGLRLIRLELTLTKLRRQIPNLTPNANNAIGRLRLEAASQPQFNADELAVLFDYQLLQERLQRNRGIALTKSVATVAPMLGLLGTVVGLIQAFEALGAQGGQDPQQMAGGIALALITTVAGMVVAIPLLLLHGALQNRYLTFCTLLEIEAAKLLAERQVAA